ncbi:MAG: SDR family oxidoreductase [Spirulinaceae cyanobacterium]
MIEIKRSLTMPETILVTAATSNVGSQVVKQLAAKDVNIRAAVRNLNRAQNFPSGVEVVEFDLNKPETVEAAFRGVDKAFFMTPLAPNLVELDATCLEAAKKAGVKQIVKLSVMGADTEPEMLLGQCHRESEQLIAASGIPYTFLRPNSFHQNYLIYTAETIKNQNSFYLPLGEGKLSFIDIRDVAEVAAVVLTEDNHQNKAYQITGSQALSNYQIAEILSQVLGRTITYVDIPEEAAREAMTENGLPEKQVEMILRLYNRQKAGNYSTITPIVEEVTGKQPRTFEQFANDYAAAFSS